MQELIDKIKLNKHIWLGNNADVLQVKDCRRYLNKKGIAEFSEDYSRFVRHINGMRTDVAELFGIIPQGDFGLLDIAMQNELIDRYDKEEVIVLGYNNFDYLIYDAKSKVYKTLDRYDDAVVEVFSGLDSALEYFFLG